MRYVHHIPKHDAAERLGELVAEGYALTSHRQMI